MAVYKSAILGIVTACVLCVTSGIKYPKFIAIPDAVRRYVVPASVWNFPKQGKNFWYAAWPTGMHLTLIGKDNVENFKLVCETESLDPGYELTKITYWFNGKAETMKSKESRVKEVVDPKGKTYKLKLSFNPSHGGWVEYVTPIDNKVDLTTKFYCSVENKLGTVMSNTLEIVDYRSSYMPKVFSVANVPSKPINKNAPFTKFKCSENGVPPKPGRPPYEFMWEFCTSEVVGRCYGSRLNTLIEDEKWPAYVEADGTLYLPYFSRSLVIKLKGKTLACSLNKIPFAFYSKPLSFADGSNDKMVKTLTMIRPKSGEPEKFTIYNSATTNVEYPCNFRIGPGDYRINWKFTPKAGGTPRSITETRIAGVRISRINPGGLNFQGPFSHDTVGRYECSVSWTTTDKRNENGVGAYDVDVLFFPTVSKKMVPLIYVVDGANGKLQCLFEGLKIKPTLVINGYPIELKTKQSVLSSVKSVNAKYNKVMAGLDVDIEPLNPRANDVLNYTAKRMVYKSVLNNLPSTHMVECVGTNEVGSVRSKTILQVVPKPELVVGKTPSNLNCSECSAAEAHTVYCQVSNLAAINASGAVFNQYWMLGNERVVDLFAVKDAPAKKYISISADNSLTIKKIDDEKFKSTVNRLGKVECVLTLSYPASTTKLPVDVKRTGLEKGLFYISSYTDLRNELTTLIKLTNIAPPTVLKTGAMMWVIPVVLAFIVILIIIGATYYCCRQRTYGEEYNVDAKEKQQGNDPEVEDAEKEAFPVFERPEDGPIRGSRASLDDSIHVGSDDEDEVLAEYDVDIGKFDEEGSFIGQYAVTDGNATGNRRLPNVGNNTEV